MIRIWPYHRLSMSRISTTWDIGRQTGLCASTGKPLAPGAVCIVALVERNDDPSAPLGRLDFSQEGWDAQASAASHGPIATAQGPCSIVAYWRTQVAAPDEKRRGLADEQTLLDLFERLGSDERPHRVRFRFVLMLLLVRKRFLRVVGTENASGVETWFVLPRGAVEGELPTSVVNPRLDDAATREVTEQLGEVLDGAW